MVAVVVGSGLVAADAVASELPDLYVNNASAKCSDAGTGAEAQPFCTLAAAAAAVSAGQTVHVAGNYHEPLTIVKSGTPQAPIVFMATLGLLSGPDAIITIDGQHDVTVSRFTVSGPTSGPGISISRSSQITLDQDIAADGGGISVSQSSQITLNQDTTVNTPGGVPAFALSAVTGATIARGWARSPAGPDLVLDAATSGVAVTDFRGGGLWRPADGIDVLGPDNTVVDSSVTEVGGAGMYVGPQADRTVLADNVVNGNRGVGVDVAGGAAVAITSNTVYDNCAGGIRVRGGASAASVQNNVVASNGPEAVVGCQPGPTPVGLGVYDAATASSIVDYNIVYQPTVGEFPYAWGVPQTTLADFRAASGQGLHDIQADPLVFPSGTVRGDSPALDAANSAAPGWQPKDHDGRVPADDPDLMDTGAGPVTFADRGAFEFKAAPVAAVTAAPRPGDPIGGWPITADASASTAGWSTITSYYFDLGDGMAVSSDKPVINYVYREAGTYHVKVTITTADGRANATDGELVVVVGDLFQSVGPVRVLDTRSAVGVPTKVPVPAHGTVHLRVAGVAGVPATGVAAVVLNTTVTTTAAAGYLTVYPDGVSRPTTSNANWTAGRTVANLVTVQVVNGVVDLYNGSSGTVHFVADLAGYYAHSTGEAFNPEWTPVRLMDTRSGLGGVTRIPAHGTAVLGVSSYWLASLVLNVTVTGGTASGYLTVYPHGQPRPVASNLNWSAGQTLANMVVVPPVDGWISFYNGSSGPVDVVADQLGEFRPDVGQPFVPASPVRVLDTRSGPSSVPVAPHATISLTLLAGTPGLPARVTAAAVFTVTVTQPTASGYLTVYAISSERPTASNLNWRAGTTVANLVVIRSGDTVQFYNGSPGTVHIVVDLVGSYAS